MCVCVWYVCVCVGVYVQIVVCDAVVVSICVAECSIDRERL